MRRLALAILTAALSALLISANALGKGAVQATIAGPGLDEPITLYAADPDLDLQALANESGFFAAVFGQTPDPMLDRKPAVDLGPRYTITYTMPGRNGERDRIVQHLYPFATPLASYLAPGQPFFTNESTRGGWYVAGAALTDRLVALGLPPSEQPTGVAGDGFAWAVAGGFAVFATVAALAAWLVMRRRPRTVTT